MEKRRIVKIFPAKPTSEGAGVHLKRGFGYFEVPQFDPFLLFDDFTSESSDRSYLRGFPEHPHRGIETVTYILKGEVRHRDSLGNAGSIMDGAIQWMTAGSGIIHEEMPQEREAGIQGFQLWVNLPRDHKMMAPRYQEIEAKAIPVVKKEGVVVKLIAGTYEARTGPVRDLMVAPTYLDVTLEPGTPFSLPTDREHTYFAYVISGRVMQREDRSEYWAGAGDIALFGSGTNLSLTAGKDGARLLLIGGKPLGESISWQGPIVMNTDEELETAFTEVQNGTFVK